MWHAPADYPGRMALMSESMSQSMGGWERSGRPIFLWPCPFGTLNVNMREIQGVSLLRLNTAKTHGLDTN